MTPSMMRSLVEALRIDGLSGYAEQVECAAEAIARHEARVAELGKALADAAKSLHTAATWPRTTGLDDLRMWAASRAEVARHAILGAEEDAILPSLSHPCPTKAEAEPDHGPKLDEIVAQTKGVTLLDALVHVAIWENDRAVRQALRGERDPHTGALWETCFRRCFEGVLGSRQRSDRAELDPYRTPAQKPSPIPDPLVPTEPVDLPESRARTDYPRNQPPAADHEREKARAKLAYETYRKAMALSWPSEYSEDYDPFCTLHNDEQRAWILVARECSETALPSNEDLLLMRRSTIEECAKVCENVQVRAARHLGADVGNDALRCADEIRALVTRGNAGGGE